MAVRLRMAVHGVRNHRIFHIVAINQRQRRGAKPIELLGVYDPRLKPGETNKTIEWSVQRIQYWLNVGATPSKTVTKLLQMGGIPLRPATTDSATSTAASPLPPMAEAAPEPSAQPTIS